MWKYTKNYLPVACLLATLLMATETVAAQKILVIHSYHADFPWVQQYSAALASRLSEFEVELSHLYLDTKRIPAARFDSTAQIAWQHYQAFKNDYSAIVLADDNAFRLLSTEFANIHIPVFFLGINNNPRNYFSSGTLPPHVSGVVERPLFIRNMVLARKLFPNLKSILVVFDDSVTSNILMKDVFKPSNLNNLGLKVRIKTINKEEDWKKTILEADEDIIFVGLYQTLTDANNLSVNENTILNWTSLNSKKPLFGFWDFSVGKNKTAGGLVLHGFEQGVLVSDLILNELNGQNKKSPRIIQSTNGHLLFSHSMLEKYKLNIPEELIDQVNWVN